MTIQDSVTQNGTQNGTQSGTRNGVKTAKPAGPVTPTLMERPAFLLNPPFSYHTSDANNVWMEEIEDDKRAVEPRKAMGQFLDFYHYLSAEALVICLPTPVSHGLQDLVFTANLGIVLGHLPERSVVVLSNYTAEARRGETAVGKSFFESMEYECHVAPDRFEGEADLKHLHDDVYVGGYGIRSSKKTYEWMEREFGMRIVKVEETDPYLYHLDTMIFPITPEQTLVCTEMFSKEEVAELEQHTGIIDVSADHCYSGITNSVRLFNSILNGSNIHELRAGTEDYKLELEKNRKLEDLAVELGFEVAYFNISEYHKGGALLSCMAMHLNRRSYDIRLL